MTNSIQSLERALSILEAFSFDDHELGIQEISMKVDLPAPTVCRFMHTLVRLGYIKQNSRNKKYSVALKVLTFAAAAYRGANIKTVAVDSMRKTRDTIKETIYLDVLDSEERVCLVSMSGGQALSLTVPVGQRSPLYAGADSRMLLTSFDAEICESYIQNAVISKLTKNTITNKKVLSEVLQKSRENDFAISLSEFKQGSACISVPVRDYSQRMIAVLSVSFPDKKANVDVFTNYSDSLIESANDISKQLGFRGKIGPKGSNLLDNCRDTELLLKRIYQ